MYCNYQKKNGTVHSKGAAMCTGQANWALRAGTLAIKHAHLGSKPNNTAPVIFVPRNHAPLIIIGLPAGHWMYPAG